MVPDTPESRDVYDRPRNCSMPILPTFSAPRAAPFTGMRFPMKAAHSHAGGSRLRRQAGTILFHGGNDSLLEEFTDLLLYLARGGYEILAFEAPDRGLHCGSPV